MAKKTTNTKSSRNNNRFTDSIYGRFVNPKPSDFINRPTITEEYEEDFDGVDIKRDRFTSTAADVGRGQQNSKGKAAAAALNKRMSSGGKGKTGKSK